jgi:hypothetical protein
LLDCSAGQAWRNVVGVAADGVAAGGPGVFSADSTGRTLEIACVSAGLDAGGAELIRLGENAIYRLQSVPLVARIARTVDYLADIETEVAAARWLESESFPAVRLSGPADQPIEADRRLVTFWELISEQAEYGTVAELAVLLRRLHDLEPPSSLVLPELQPFARVDVRIDGADLAADDRVSPGMAGKAAGAVRAAGFRAFRRARARGRECRQHPAAGV